MTAANTPSGATCPMTSGDDSFLKQAKVGVRYADRDQTVRYSLYNWGVLSEVWAGSGPVHFNETPSTDYGLYTFADVFRGDGPTSTNANYINGNPATDYDDIAAKAQAINAQWVAKGGVPGWTPTGQRAGVVAGTNFLPSEIYSNNGNYQGGIRPTRFRHGGAPTCSVDCAYRATSGCVISRRSTRRTASSPSRRATRSSASRRHPPPSAPHRRRRVRSAS